MLFWDLLDINLSLFLILIVIWSVFYLHRYIKCKIPIQLVFMLVWIFFVSSWFSIPDKEMQILSWLAIIFMLFTSELTWHSVPHFFKSIYKNLRVAIIAAIGPWLWAFLFSNLWWWSFNEAVALWAVFTATALPFTIWVLREYKILNSKAAHTAISAATADDILATLVWIITSILLWAWINAWVWSWLDYSEIVIKLWLVLWFFLFIYILHEIFSRTHIFKRFHGWSLLIMLIWWIVTLIWEFVFHIHYAIAALFAWVLLNPEFFNEKLSKFSKASDKLEKASVYIWPFFFVYLWMNLNLVSVFENSIIIISWFLLFLSVFVLQFLTAYFSWKSRWLDHNNALTLGFAMSPRDVVAIVILEMNIAYISDQTIFPSVIFAILLLNITATLWLKYWAKKLKKKTTN